MENVNWFLIAAAVIFLALTIIGAVRGFIHTIFVTFGLIIIIVLTMIFNPYIKSFILENTDMSRRISNKIESKLRLDEKIDKSIYRDDTAYYLQNVELPDEIKRAINDVVGSKLPRSSETLNKKESSAESLSKTAISLIYEGMTDLAIGAIAYLITFAIASLLVLVAYLLLGLASKLPAIRTMNTLLGGIFGFLQAYLVLSLIYAVAVAFSSTTFGMSVLESIKQSEILTWFYGHNFITNLLLSLFKG